MVSFLAITLYFIGIFVVVSLSLSGRINLGLLFLVPLFPLRNVIEKFHQLPLGKDMVDIILLAMLIGWYVKSSKKNRIEQKPLTNLLIFLIIYTFVSLCIGSLFLGVDLPFNPGNERVQDWKNYVTFPLLYFITVNNIEDINDIKRLTFVMGMSILLVDYYSWNQIRWMSGPLSRDKIHGTFVYLGPNELAAFLGSYTFVFAAIIRSVRNKFAYLLYAMTILMSLFCVVFLYSRGAYLAVVSVFVVFAILRKKVLLIPIVVLLLSWQSILPQTVIERINETKSSEGSLDVSSQSRLDLWKISMGYFDENPVFGVGFDTIKFLNLTGGLRDTHNIYLKILAEQGLIGIAIILMLFWNSLKYGWKLYVKSNEGFLKGLGFGFVLCVVSLMVANLFGDRWTHWQVGAYFWVFLALVIRGNFIVEEGLKTSMRA